MSVVCSPDNSSNSESEFLLFPCMLEVIDDIIVYPDDPNYVVCKVLAGVVTAGIPICASCSSVSPSPCGIIEEIKDRDREKVLKFAEAGMCCSLRIKDSPKSMISLPADTILVTKFTRESIDDLKKAHFRNVEEGKGPLIRQEEWRLVMKIRDILQIPPPQ